MNFKRLQGQSPAKIDLLDAEWDKDKAAPTVQVEKE